MSITNKLNTCALARLIQLGKMNISDSQIDFKVWYFKTRWRLLGKWFLSFRSMSRIDENLRREGLTSLSLSQFTTNLRWQMLINEFRSMSRIDENLRREGLTSLSLSQFTTNLRRQMLINDYYCPDPFIPGSINDVKVHNLFHINQLIM